MTRAIILAAGFGSRLMPLTADRPKGMVALAGLPLLARQIDVLRAGGVHDIHVVGGYLADRLQVLGCPVVHNPAYDSTNMVESLFCARDLLDGSTDVLMCYGDIVYESRVLQAVLAGAGEIVITADRRWRNLWQARMEDYAGDVETFRIGADGRVLELGKRPRSLDEVQAQYIGLVRFPAAVHARLRAFHEGLDRTASYDGQPFPKMYMTSFLQQLIDAGWDARPALIDGGWLEVDTLEDLRRYHALHARDELEVLCRLEPPADPRALVARLTHAVPDGAAGTCDIAQVARSVAQMPALEAEHERALDLLARKIEIAGYLYRRYRAEDMKPMPGSPQATPEEAAALLAAYLVAHDLTQDARHLNTVLKALDGILRTPQPAARLQLDHACAARLREWC